MPYHFSGLINKPQRNRFYYSHKWHQLPNAGELFQDLTLQLYCRGKLCNDIWDEYGNATHRRRGRSSQTEAPDVERIRHSLRASNDSQHRRQVEQNNPGGAAICKPHHHPLGSRLAIRHGKRSCQRHCCHGSGARLRKRYLISSQTLNSKNQIWRHCTKERAP